MSFDLDNLKMFMAAIEHGSFSAAARALRRVPSAVSMAIGNLEAELGLPLFDRAGREPKPTPAALALLPQARVLLEQLDRLNVHALALTRGLETSLALAVVPELLGAAQWTEALRTLSDEFPLLHIEVLTAAQPDALALAQSGRVQLALVFERYGVAAEESFEEVGQERLIAVAAPTHELVAALPAGGIRDEHLLSRRQIVVAGRDSDHVDKRLAVSTVQWRTDNPVAAMSLVAAGLGWAWLPAGFVRDALDSGRLVALPLANLTNEVRLYVDLVWTTGRPLGIAARRFIELLHMKRQRAAPIA